MSKKNKFTLIQALQILVVFAFSAFISSLSFAAPMMASDSRSQAGQYSCHSKM